MDCSRDAMEQMRSRLVLHRPTIVMHCVKPSLRARSRRWRHGDRMRRSTGAREWTFDFIATRLGLLREGRSTLVAAIPASTAYAWTKLAYAGGYRAVA